MNFATAEVCSAHSNPAWSSGASHRHRFATGTCTREPCTPPKAGGICSQQPLASPSLHPTPTVKLLAGCWVWKRGLYPLGVRPSFRDMLNHLCEHLCAWGKKDDERERVRAQEQSTWNSGRISPNIQAVPAKAIRTQGSIQLLAAKDRAWVYFLRG